MNKSELIEIVAKEANIGKAVAGKALDALLDSVVKAVAKGRHRHLARLRHLQTSQTRRQDGQESANGRRHQDRRDDRAEVFRRHRLQDRSGRQEEG